MFFSGVLTHNVSAADDERIVVAYDDLGVPEKSPHLKRGRHLRKWQGSSAPEFSVAHDPEKLVLEYENLNPELKYGLEITCVSSGKRVQKLSANGNTVYDNYLLPAGIPEKKTFILPDAIIGSDGKLVLEFFNVKGPNTVVSELALFSVGADSGDIKNMNGKFKEQPDKKKQEEIEIRSSLDGEMQKCIVLCPENPADEKMPLLVALHSWGGDYRQKVGAYGPPALKKGFYVIFPDYRGPNSRNLKAMGSKYAVQDIIDAVDYMVKNYPIDRNRIYIAGASGGGHMALLMAGKHPEIWAAVSAWCGISDLAKWYAQNPAYAMKIKSCIGAAPGSSSETDREYMERSPLYHIKSAANVPLQIFHGTKDKVIPVEQADEIVALMRENGFKELEYLREDKGHVLDPRRMLDFLAKHRKGD